MQKRPLKGPFLFYNPIRRLSLYKPILQMKKRIVFFTLAIGLCYFLMSSYSHGAATSGFICCGAKSSVTNCAGSSCHGAGEGTTSFIAVKNLDGSNAGSYTPGATYTIIVGGNNPLLLPKFGFQFAAVTGTGTAQTQAGTYTAYPSFVTGNYISGIMFVEQTEGINADTPGIYRKTLQWKAPTTPGLGFVRMYLTLLAVNGNNVADTLDVSNNILVVLAEDHSATSVQNIGNTLHINAWPNPASNSLNVTIDNGQQGDYSIIAYDLNGRLITNETVTLSGVLKTATINTTSWQPGLYKVLIRKDNAMQETTIVKQ